MKKGSLVFLIMMACITAKGRERYGLVIGINEYISNAQNASVRQLRGCVNDAKCMKGLLTTRFGFRESNIDTLFDRQATKVNILSRFKKLVEKAGKDDIIFIFYAGHGISFINSLAQKEEKTTQGILSSDITTPYNSVIFDFELGKYYNQLIAKGAIVTALFDCCHSGKMPMMAGKVLTYFGYTGMRGVEPQDLGMPDDVISVPEEGNDEAGRTIPYTDSDLQIGNHVQRPHEIPNSKFLFIGSAQSDQTAHETIDAAGNIHGMFTKALLSVYEKNSANISVNDLFHGITQSFANKYISTGYQLPNLLLDETRMQQNLLGVNDGKLTDSLVIGVKKIFGKSIILAGGIYQGLAKGYILRGIKSKDILIKINVVPGVEESNAVMLQGDSKKLSSEKTFLVIQRKEEVDPVLKIYVPAKDFSLAEVKTINDKLAPMLAANTYWPFEETDDVPYSIVFDNRLIYKAGLGQDLKLITAQEMLASFQQKQAEASYCLYLPIATELYAVIKKKLANNPNIRFVNNIKEANFSLYSAFTKDKALVITLTNSIIGTRMTYLEEMKKGNAFRPSSHEADKLYIRLVDPFNSARTEKNATQLTELILRIAGQLRWLND